MKRKITLVAFILTALLFAGAASASIPSIYEALNQKDAVKAKYLYVSPSSVTLYLGNDQKGESKTLNAKAKPVTASQSFSWLSKNELIAGVDSSGVVTPLSLGKAKIVCGTTDQSNLKRTVYVTVKPLKVSEITLNKTELTVIPNKSDSLSYTYSPANAYNTSITWKSSKPNIACVDSNGVVTGKNIGSCVITCVDTISGVKAKATVNVSLANSDVYYMSIGQQNYKTAGVLNGCKMDADRFSATVSASQFGNASQATGRTLYDLTGAQLKSAFADVKNMGMDENDVTYIYYSGHGTNRSTYEGALVGIDHGAKPISETCISVAEIRQYLDQVPGTVVIAIDACHSGNFITSKSVDSLNAGDFTYSFIKAFSQNANAKSIIDDNELKDKYKLIVACLPEESSFTIDNGFGSVFTKFVTQAGGVTGMNAGKITVTKKLLADSNGDGIASLKEIFSYSYPRIVAMIKKASIKDGKKYKQHMMVWPTADAYPVFARLS